MEAISSQGILVKWNAIPDGMVMSYTVKYRRLGSDGSWSSKVMGRDDTQATISRLNKFTTYEVKVLGTSQLDGPASPVQNVTTFEDGKLYWVAHDHKE